MLRLFKGELMRVYVDFDGVILDTDSIIDRDYSKVKDISRTEFVKNYNWNILVNEATVINNSLYNLSNSKYETYILSKISSVEEGISKVRYLRDNDVFINVHLVPTKISKSDVVNAKGNVLIDDKIYNLDEWVSKGGIGIFFNKDNLDFDVKGKENINYKKISNLNILISGELK